LQRRCRMTKIFIVGIVASGKTTFAKKLSIALNIPHYELDCVVHVNTANGEYKRTPQEQLEELTRIDGLGDWILEGTFRESYRCLLDMATHIIFLDPPLRLRKRRILTRCLKPRLHLEACHYKSDLTVLKQMYKWTRDFEQNRVQFEGLLEKYQPKLTKITARRIRLAELEGLL